MLTKHWMYLKYVLTHKYYVFRECLNYGLIWQGLIHDWTKFLPSEWSPYVQYFYGDGGQGAFDIAWNHHQKRNPHHWQYWLLRNDNQGSLRPFNPLPMPDRFRKEMLCDWRGAGMAQGKSRESTREWYLENKTNIVLHLDTQSWIEQELRINDFIH